MVQYIALHNTFPWPFSFHLWASELAVKTKRQTRSQKKKIKTEIHIQIRLYRQEY